MAAAEINVLSKLLERLKYVFGEENERLKLGRYLWLSMTVSKPEIDSCS